MEKYCYKNGAELTKETEDEFVYISPKGNMFHVFRMLEFVGIYHYAADDDDNMGELVWWFCDWDWFMNEWENGVAENNGPIEEIDNTCTTYENNGMKRADWMRV